MVQYSKRLRYGRGAKNNAGNARRYCKNIKFGKKLFLFNCMQNWGGKPRKGIGEIETENLNSCTLGLNQVYWYQYCLRSINEDL